MLTQITTATLSLSLLALSACAASDPDIENTPGEEAEQEPEEVYLEEMVVGPDGAILDTAFGARVVVPPDAVAADTTLTIEMTQSYLCGLELSDRYEFGPALLDFAVPLTVMLPVPPGIENPVVVTETLDNVPGREVPSVRSGDFLLINIECFDGAGYLVMARSAAEAGVGG